MGTQPSHLHFSSGLIVPLLLLLCGCGGGVETQSPSQELPPYPPSLSTSSSPTEVAQVLVAALDADDDRTLKGLVAAKHETDAINAIYEKHGREGSVSPNNAVNMAVAGWKLTYSWFRPGSTRIVSERLAGDTAVVEAEGVNPNTGRPRSLTIEMITEDNVWKVQAGLESAEM